jgi:hypothetical protein
MDLRIVKRLTKLKSCIKEYQTVKIRQFSEGHSSEIGNYRLLSNNSLTENYLYSDIYSRCGIVSENKEVLVLSDSTDFDYSKQFRRIKPNSGLGYIGNGSGLGYNAHVSLVVDATNESIYGLSDIYLWHRVAKKSPFRLLTEARTEYNILKKKQLSGFLSPIEEKRYEELSTFSIEIDGQKYSTIYQLPFEYRESYRWLQGIRNSDSVLSNVNKVTYVQDREGDMYDTFVNLPTLDAHLLIRSRSNRPILTADGKKHHIHDYRHELTELGKHDILVRDRDTGIERTARIGIKSATVSLLRGSLNAQYEQAYPNSVTVNVVYAEEVATSVPADKEPIFWCLITTHEVTTLEQVIKITYWYSMRWIIEIFFRLLKKSGFQLEASELETGYALRKLGILTMEAAIQALQLKQARTGDETLGIDTIFTEQEVECLESILPEWEGNTDKQKNPFPSHSLPWATWIIARLGGWKGYKNNRPPGVLCLRNGLLKFKNIYYGFKIANSKSCV